MPCVPYTSHLGEAAFFALVLLPGGTLPSTLHRGRPHQSAATLALNHTRLVLLDAIHAESDAGVASQVCGQAMSALGPAAEQEWPGLKEERC